MEEEKSFGTCVCCGARFEQKGQGRPATMCGACRKMKSSERPQRGGEPLTRSCVACGKVFQVERKSSGEFYAKCRRCLETNRKSQNFGARERPRRGNELADATEGSLMVGGIAANVESYDLGACERCAYRDALGCSMLKPGFDGTCEWFSAHRTRPTRRAFVSGSEAVV